MTPAELRAKVATSRVAQGLPPTVQDPAALERAAAVMRLVTYHGEAGAACLPAQRRQTATVNDREVAPSPTQ
ncbi:MAG: hypothetical protein ACRDRU_27345 [Pseudonocardiaceae bacterium]